MRFFCISLILFFLHNLAAATFYINPHTGDNHRGDGSEASPWQTLEYVINNNLIQSHAYFTPFNTTDPQIQIKNVGAPIHEGDTILLFSGLHGSISISNYINQQPITILGANNQTPILKNLHFRGAKNWKIKNVSISSEPYGTYINDKLIFLESHGWHGPVSHISLCNNSIYSAAKPWTKASDWVTKVSNGIIIMADSISIENNSIENIGFGISLQGNNNRCIQNSITNFSGDGIRILGSYNQVKSNTIKNCYKVDDNHDDGIQSYTTGGLIVDNNTISGNFIFNYEDPNQPLLGTLQGIGCFDGPYNNWIIENNVIYVNHWHGIAMYGATNCKIVNNTVIDPTPSDSIGTSWILIDNDNTIRAENCIVKNNICNQLNINTSTKTQQSNNLLLKNNADYQQNFLDYNQYNFNLKHNAPAIDNADDTFAPAKDIVNTKRPQGDKSDIGAYELKKNTNTINHIETQHLTFYPNPAHNKLHFPLQFKNAHLEIYDKLGRKVLSHTSKENLKSINISKLIDGVYFISVHHNEMIYIGKFIKQ